MPQRQPGHREGVRRYQRYDQMALGVTDTLAYAAPDLDDDVPEIGTCQSCGAYWDVRHYKRCPATVYVEGAGYRCDGHIG